MSQVRLLTSRASAGSRFPPPPLANSNGDDQPVWIDCTAGLAAPPPTILRFVIAPSAAIRLTPAAVPTQVAPSESNEIVRASLLIRPLAVFKVVQLPSLDRLLTPWAVA